jgi:ABC-type multidrug transport system ATPase subunit
MNDILAADHIHKKYGGKPVLQDASIHVKQGEIYGLIGKNGSGKTTLLRILTGLIPTYSGTVAVGDVNGQKARMSTVIHSPSLFLNMSAWENLKEHSCLLGIQDHEEIVQALRAVGLEENRHKLVKHFSLGMTQRLKLAMALLAKPDILILDEPVNGLDPEGIADLRALLLRLNKTSDLTILISSHILSELEQIATCFGILHQGRMVKEITKKDVRQSEHTLEELYMLYSRGGKNGA